LLNGLSGRLKREREVHEGGDPNPEIPMNAMCERRDKEKQHR